MQQDRYERYIDHVKPEQALAIGSWVLALSYMQRVSSYIAKTDNLTLSVDGINASTKIFLSQIRDKEFKLVRESFAKIEPDTNAHIARNRMGVVGKTQQRMGNRYFRPNKEFILATYYEEDAQTRTKIDANADVSGVIDADKESFVDFYVNRTLDILNGRIKETILPEIIHTTRQEMEYWLSETGQY